MLHVPLNNEVTPMRALKEGVCVLAQEAFDAVQDPDPASESELIRAAGESHRLLTNLDYCRVCV